MKIYQIREGSETRGWIGNSQDLNFIIQTEVHTTQMRNGVYDTGRDYVVRAYFTALDLIYKDTPT